MILVQEREATSIGQFAKDIQQCVLRPAIPCFIQRTESCALKEEKCRIVKAVHSANINLGGVSWVRSADLSGGSQLC